MPRSLNKALIIGNLTRDPVMRYTPQGHAVTSFGVATNREWTTNGERKEATEFHNVVAWGKLAELCSQLLSKGRKVYIEGRLQTRTWDDQNGVKHYKTEIVADDMVILDPRPAGVVAPPSPTSEPKTVEPKDQADHSDLPKPPEEKPEEKKEESASNPPAEVLDESVAEGEIPF